MGPLIVSLLFAVESAVTPVPNDHLEYWMKIIRVSPLKMVRKNAARNLGKMGDPNVIPVLAEAMRDPELSVKLEAIKALGNLGDEKAIPVLKGAENDRDKEIRKSAKDAIEKIKAVVERQKQKDLKETKDGKDKNVSRY